MSDQAHASGHPTPATYAKIAVILCLITFVEFGAFYVEEMFGPTVGAAFAPIFVPMLVVLSLAKFLLVVMFYMHLKFDHPIFTKILAVSAVIAVITMLWLFGLFLYSHPLGV